MTVDITLNGQVYPYPETGDTGWGSNATAYAVAVAASCLQKSGGSFILTNEVDFGANFGLKSLVYKSHSSNIADTGNVRFGVGDSIVWRNNANDDNLALAIDASNNLTFNGIPLVTGSGSTFAANRVIVTDSGGSLTVLPAGTSGQVLTSNGATVASFQNTTGSGTVNSGTAGRVALYPSAGSVIDDTYTQNANLISLQIASHATLAATRTYTVPDAGANASFVLTQGASDIGTELLAFDTTTTNGFGSAGRIGFGTVSPQFKYHFYADGDPLLYQLTYVGDPFDTGTDLPKGVLGPLANNIWWDKSGGAPANIGDAGFLGTIIFNTDLGGGMVTHQELAEIGVVVVDPANATRTARMQFELNSNGHSFQTVIGKSMGGAFMTLDPILNDGATLKVGPGETIVGIAPINGGAYISSDDYSNALYTAGSQYMGSNVFTARGTDPIVLDLGASAAHTFRVCTDSGKTSGNTYTPTPRLTINTTGISAALPLDMGSHKITSLSDGTASTDAVNKGQLDTAVAVGIPPGVILPYGGSSAPTGYLLCDGTSYLRATYAALFAVIGTAYGSADGTHFNVPTSTDKIPMGSGANAIGVNVGSATHVHAIPHKHETPIWRRTSDGSLIVKATAPYGTGTTVSDATGGGGFTAGSANDPNTTYLTNDTDTANSASASTLQPAFVTQYIIKT